MFVFVMWVLCSRPGIPRGEGPGHPGTGQAGLSPLAHGPALCSLRSARKGRPQQDPRGWWLKGAILLLLSAAAGGGLVVWSRVRTQDGVTEGGIPADGVTEVLAHRSDNLQDKFMEIPCSEDYDNHKRFAGRQAGLSAARGGAQRAETAWHRIWAAKLPCFHKLLLTVSCLKP